MADTNGDKQVSLEEFVALERISKIPEAQSHEIFKRFDKNGDGMIQTHEMKPPQRREGREGRDRPFPRLHELDTDKSGSVTFEEFSSGPFAEKLPAERLRTFFDKLDRNGDGVLSPKDMPHERGGPRGPRGPQGGGQERGMMFETLDQNGDGALSFAEFRLAPWVKDRGEDEQEDQFERIDKDGNLLIEKSELMRGGPPETGGKGPKGRGLKDRDQTKKERPLPRSAD